MLDHMSKPDLVFRTPENEARLLEMAKPKVQILNEDGTPYEGEI